MSFLTVSKLERDIGLWCSINTLEHKSRPRLLCFETHGTIPGGYRLREKTLYVQNRNYYLKKYKIADIQAHNVSHLAGDFYSFEILK